MDDMNNASCSSKFFFFLNIGQGTIGHGMFHASQHFEQIRQYLFLYLIMKNKAYFPPYFGLMNENDYFQYKIFFHIF